MCSASGQELDCYVYVWMNNNLAWFVVGWHSLWPAESGNLRSKFLGGLVDCGKELWPDLLPLTAASKAFGL